jgi:hypothetical protein
MRVLDPEGPMRRFPGKTAITPRGQLTCPGALRELSGDGHCKLNSQALGMGVVSLSIYGFRDKFSGFITHLVVIPDNRRKEIIAHVFLDQVQSIHGE